MSLEQAVNIKIEDNDKSNAAMWCRWITTKETKTRAFTNALAADLAMKHLGSLGIDVLKLHNLHHIRHILGDIDIADIMLANIHIDVRFVYNENYIFIPKSHSEYGIEPDIYIVFKLAYDKQSADLIGFFEPKMLNKNNFNNDYYFFEKEKLSSPSDLHSFVLNFDGNTYQYLGEDENEHLENLMLQMVDDDITDEDKKYLLAQLVKSDYAREKFIEFENFELLAHKAQNEIGIENNIIEPYIETETEFEDFTEYNPANEDNLVGNALDVLDELDEALSREKLLDNLYNYMGDNVFEIELNGKDKELPEVDEEESQDTVAVEEDSAETVVEEENEAEIVEPDLDDDFPSFDELEDITAGFEDDIDTDEEIAEDYDNNEEEAVETIPENEPEVTSFDGIAEAEPEQLDESFTEPELNIMEELESTLNADLDLSELEKIDVEPISFDAIEPVVDITVDETPAEEVVKIEEVTTEQDEEPKEEIPEQLEAVEVSEEETAEFPDEISEQENVEEISEVEPSLETFETLGTVTEEEEIVQTEEFEPDVVGFDNFETTASEIAEEPVLDIEEKTLSEFSNIEMQEVSEPDINEKFEETSEPEEQPLAETQEESVEEIQEPAPETDEIENTAEFEKGYEFTPEIPETQSYESEDIDNALSEIENILAAEQETSASHSKTDDTTQEDTDKIQILFSESDKTDGIKQLQNLSEENGDEAPAEPSFLKLIKNTDKKNIAAVAALVTIASCLIIYATMFRTKTPTVAEDMSIPNNEIINENIPLPPETDSSDLNANTPDLQPITKEEMQAAKQARKQVRSTAPANQTNVTAGDYITVSKISWEVPYYLSASENFRQYLQTAGKSIKLSLSSDLLTTSDYAYSNQVKVDLSMTKDGSVKNAAVVTSSGSDEIDNIVLQTVKDTLNVVKPPSGEVQGANLHLVVIINF